MAEPPQGAGGSQQQPDALPPKVPRPHFMRKRPFIPDRLLRDKKEDWYLTILPGVGYNENKGVVVAGLAEVYYNGKRDDPFFRTAPYRRKIFTGGGWGSNDYWDVRLNLDEPYIAGSPWRLRVENRAEHRGRDLYFGVGEDAMGPLSFSGSDQTYDRFGDYNKELERHRDGVAYSRYNNVDTIYFRSFIAGELDLWGGILRPLVGFSVAHFWISDYTGEEVDAVDEAGEDVRATQASTKLSEDCEAGLVTGCDGGFDNFLKIGVTLDTRHFEPDPDYGIVAQIAGEFSGKFIGSVENYIRLTTQVSGYYRLFPKLTRLIAAGRLLYSMGFGDIPFFAQNTYALNTEDRFGLGDFQTMRGQQRNRYVGKVGAMLNLEMRWYFAKWQLWSQDLGFGVVPFFETGRVWDEVGDISFDKWQWSTGGGLRVTWNLSTVISFDYGFSKETRVFVMELGHQF